MKGHGLICLAAGVLLIGVACEKPPEPRPEATLALGGLMPSAPSEFQSIYVADQKTIDTLPERTDISYEPLKKFRTGNRSKAGQRAGSAKVSSGSKTSEKKGPIGRLKQKIFGFLGGGGPRPGANMPPGAMGARGGDMPSGMPMGGANDDSDEDLDDEDDEDDEDFDDEDDEDDEDFDDEDDEDDEDLDDEDDEDEDDEDEED